MTIEYLSACKGASKFGNCVNCGAGSREGSRMAWISFAPQNSGRYTTICLCRECRLKLVSKILTDDAIIESITEVSMENMEGDTNDACSDGKRKEDKNE